MYVLHAPPHTHIHPVALYSLTVLYSSDTSTIQSICVKLIVCLKEEESRRYETKSRPNGYRRSESTKNDCKDDRVLLTEKCKTSILCIYTSENFIGVLFFLRCCVAVHCGFTRTLSMTLTTNLSLEVWNYSLLFLCKLSNGGHSE